MTEQSSGNGGGRELKGADSFEIKVGLAEMLKGGVIMDVTTPDQAKVAEEAGAVAVMALERVPADIRKEGASFDLPIALGILAASGLLPCELLAGSVFVGELSLDGGIRAVKGALPMAMATFSAILIAA